MCNTENEILYYCVFRYMHLDLITMPTLNFVHVPVKKKKKKKKKMSKQADFHT